MAGKKKGSKGTSKNASAATKTLANTNGNDSNDPSPAKKATKKASAATKKRKNVSSPGSNVDSPKKPKFKKLNRVPKYSGAVFKPKKKGKKGSCKIKTVMLFY